MVRVVRDRSSLWAFWCDRARDHWQAPRRSDYEETRAKKRVENLKTLREEADKALTTYGWIDKTKGLARIPIERAMELTVADLAKQKPAPAGPIATPEAQATASAPASATSPAPATSSKPDGAQASPQAVAPVAAQGAAVSSPQSSPAAQASASPAASQAPTSPSPAKSP